MSARSPWLLNLGEKRSAVMAENLNRLARGEALLNLVQAPRG